MKVFRSVRQVSHTAYLAGFATLCSSGCATNSIPLASLNPFSSKTAETVADVPPTSSSPGQLATMRQAATGQANNLSMAASSAWSKTKSGMTGLWGGPEPTTDQAGNRLADDDPTRLSSPASVSPEVFVAQGALWETTGDFAKAMDSYTRALQVEPGNASALASVARLHMRQENFPLAADHFRKALAVSPADPALLNDYGMTQAKLGDLAGASQSIGQALQAAPGTSRFANNLANVRYDAGDSEGALAVLMQHNKPAVAHFNMAYLHYRGGNYSDARAQLNEVIEFEPLAERDSAVATAVARSRDMLAQLDGGAARIAQAAPWAAATAHPAVNTFHAPQPGQPTTQVQAMTPPSFATTPTAGQTQGPTAPQASAPTASAPTASAPTASAPTASPSGQGGPFALPPGVFDQPLR